MPTTDNSSQLRHQAKLKAKQRENHTVWGKLEVAHSNQRRFGYIRSLKYHLVVMLGARINVIQPQIRNLIAYLMPLPDKKKNDDAVIKHNKTSRLNRNDFQKCSRLQRTLLIRYKVLSFVVMSEFWRFHASHNGVVYELMSVCMCVKQQTDDL